MSSDTTSNVGTPCRSCGAVPATGFADCQAMWDQLLAESFSNFAYARLHRAIVDAYSLQHPDPYCKSAKSYAAHLTGMCCAVEHGGAPAVNAAVQAWLSTNPAIDKPDVPAARGRLTIVSVLEPETPSEITAALETWFDDVWGAYEAQHGITREWIQRVSGAGGETSVATA